MRLGDMEIRHIHSGNFYLDGGAMFGVVPKPLWEKKSPPDSRNRIRLAANSLLVRAANKNILIETGNGTKWTPKLRDIYAIDEGDPLTQNLATAGVSPSQVDLVINTHLHFDHAGGNTKLLDDHAVPSFPNAQYIVQAEELAHAVNATERDRASYFEDNFLPMRQSGQWKLISGDTEILPGISVVRTPGHNTSIQAVQLTGGGKTVFFVADLFPTRHHLPLAWIMAYDLYPLQTLETKRKWMRTIVEDGWIVVFGHDPDVPAATLYERENKVAFEPVDLNR
ncbi:MAG: MBL fold metallo-hydrolase [Acidobacteria bacterium]|nr:MAG: MBL fold metallo-hydrolase [Acidobacteriota bacterium]